MAKLTQTCPYCSKNLEQVSTSDLGGLTYNVYKCGHALVQQKEHAANLVATKSFNGKHEAYEYQKEGIEFVMNNGYNAMIADQMGLGKTPQSLLALRNNYENLTPCLIIVKSATTYQWIRQYKHWCDPTPLGIFIIEGSKKWIPPAFKSYVISMDTFSRDGMVDQLLAFGFKFCIVDEAHSFKNASSKRAQALVRFFKEINSIELVHVVPLVCGMCKHTWEEEVKVQADDNKSFVSHSSFCPGCNAQTYSRSSREKVNFPERRCKCLLLTGTPIINRADEYFVALNLLDPTSFHSVDRFRKDWLEKDSKGKWPRVKPYLLEEFKEKISHYVIRRESNKVLKDLPPFRRTYTTIAMESEALKKLYNKEIQKLVEKQAEANGKDVSYLDIQANISSMRRITALAKIDYIIDWCDQFIEEVEDEKVTLGIHHKDVRDSLMFALKHHKPLSLSGEDSAEQKDFKLRQFQKPDHRILVCNTLAGGVGLDMQFCNNAKVLERQWSSAMEDQFEFRFQRPGQTRPVQCDYVHIAGTIDEYFHGLVEGKREIFGETVENDYTPYEISDDAMQFIDWSAANKL